MNSIPSDILTDSALPVSMTAQAAPKGKTPFGAVLGEIEPKSRVEGTPRRPANGVQDPTQQGLEDAGSNSTPGGSLAARGSPESGSGVEGSASGHGEDDPQAPDRSALAASAREIPTATPMAGSQATIETAPTGTLGDGVGQGAMPGTPGVASGSFGIVDPGGRLASNAAGQDGATGGGPLRPMNAAAGNPEQPAGAAGEPSEVRPALAVHRGVVGPESRPSSGSHGISDSPPNQASPVRPDALRSAAAEASVPPSPPAALAPQRAASRSLIERRLSEIGARGDVGSGDPLHSASHHAAASEGAASVSVAPKGALHSAHQALAQNAPWAEALAPRLMQLATQNGGRMLVELHPAELGNLEIRVEVDRDDLRVTVNVQHTLARDLADQHVQRLRELLANQGFSSVAIDVEQREASRDGSHSERAPLAEGTQKAAEVSHQDQPLPTTLSVGLIDAYV